MKAIYGIINLITGHQYVGSAKNFYKRKRSHLTRLRANIHHSPYLQNSWNKYGEQNFKFILLEKIVEDNMLLIREQWWINNSHSEYNICKIAGSSIGVKRRQETKDKVRNANLGLKHPDWRNKIKSKAQGGENHWTKKKNFSEESKIKMSFAQKKLYESGYIHPFAKVVIEVDENNIVLNEWSSSIKVGKFYNVSSMTIRNIIAGKNSRKLKNKIFKYV